MDDDGAPMNVYMSATPGTTNPAQPDCSTCTDCCTAGVSGLREHVIELPKDPPFTIPAMSNAYLNIIVTQSIPALPISSSGTDVPHFESGVVGATSFPWHYSFYCDTVPPTITCPLNVTADNDATLCSRTLLLPSASASDNFDSSVDVQCVLPDTTPIDTSTGDSLPVGDTQINCTATDDSGNTGELTVLFFSFICQQFIYILPACIYIFQIYIF